MGHEASVNRYLASLPKGPEGYKDCSVTAVLYRRLLRDESHIKIVLDASAAFFASHQRVATQDTTHIALTLHVAAVLAFAQTRQLSSSQTKAQIRSYGRDILSGPIYRRVFSLLSPSVMLLAAPHRYAHDFKGVKLVSKQLSKTSGSLTVTHPPHIYPAFYVESYNGIFEAGAEAASAQDVTSSLQEFTDIGSTSVFTWK